MVEVETVAIFRDLLRKNKFYSNKVIVEEQISNNPRIKKLLQNASKSGPGSGRPEFIIQHKELDDFLIVVECKDDIKKHMETTILHQMGIQTLDFLAFFADFSAASSRLLSSSIA